MASSLAGTRLTWDFWLLFSPQMMCPNPLGGRIAEIWLSSQARKGDK